MEEVLENISLQTDNAYLQYTMLRKVHFFNDRTVVLLKRVYALMFFKHTCLILRSFRVIFCRSPLFLVFVV